MAATERVAHRVGGREVATWHVLQLLYADDGWLVGVGWLFLFELCKIPQLLKGAWRHKGAFDPLPGGCHLVGERHIAQESQLGDKLDRDQAGQRQSLLGREVKSALGPIACTHRFRMR